MVKGSLSSIEAPGSIIIIINDAKACFDIMEKQSVISSGRPVMVFGGEMFVLRS